MQTRNQILNTSRLLFNENGVMNVTLRQVAKALGKSYGNITYHFPTKEDVLTALFEEMNAELAALQSSESGNVSGAHRGLLPSQRDSMVTDDGRNSRVPDTQGSQSVDPRDRLADPNTDARSQMLYLLKLPDFSFDITVKYLFFTVDYSELKRNFHSLFEKVNLLNETRRLKWKQLLLNLRDEGYFEESISSEDLDFIMFLSVSLRGAYFQFHDRTRFGKPEYATLLNKMLKPYLSDKGLLVYNDWLASEADR
jgi:AcrR family transcriptional regulator